MVAKDALVDNRVYAMSDDIFWTYCIFLNVVLIGYQHGIRHIYIQHVTYMYM